MILTPIFGLTRPDSNDYAYQLGDDMGATVDRIEQVLAGIGANPSAATTGLAAEIAARQATDARVTTLEAATALPLVMLRQTASTSHATGWTTVSWQTEDYDPDGLHDTVVNASRVTIARKGWYRVRGQLAAVSSVANYAGTKLIKNGGAVTWATSWRTISATPNIENLYVRPSPQLLLPGDYLEVQIGLTAGATANTSVGGVDGNGSWLMVECMRLVP